jgi:hypothetical protein
MDRSFTVTRSLEGADGQRCVDILRGASGFGWVECRRDPEDSHGWRRLGAVRDGFASEGETPGPTEQDWSDAISSVEEIIEDARNGRMFILVDHEDRENEGDLVIPAQMATPDAINFMATHGRGLICLR